MAEAMVNVPRRLIEELQQYMKAQPEPAILVDENQGAWTENMVVQFREQMELRYTQGAQVFKAAADASPKVLNYREFCKKTGLGGPGPQGKQLSAELGAASKLSRRLFGKVTWPMSARDTSGGMTYQMPLEVARWWLGK